MRRTGFKFAYESMYVVHVCACMYRAMYLNVKVKIRHWVVSTIILHLTNF